MFHGKAISNIINYFLDIQVTTNVVLQRGAPDARQQVNLGRVLNQHLQHRLISIFTQPLTTLTVRWNAMVQM